MKPLRFLSLITPVLLALVLSVTMVEASGLLMPVSTPNATLAITSVSGTESETPTPTQTATATEVPPTATATDLPPTATATDLPPTPTPTATTPSQPGFFRPVVVMGSYGARPKTITPGGSLSLDFSLVNQGQVGATNIIVTFSAGDLMPRQNGGVIAAGALGPGESRSFTQGFSASSTLTGLGAVSLQVNINYTNENGTAFTESLSVAVNSSLPQATAPPPSGPARPTPTPTSALQAQLVIQDTKTDVEILQPGTRFTLEIMVSNVGNADARRVTMIAGGGTLPPADPNNPDGTDTPGGVSATGGDFTNFSPLGASNVQSIGDIPAGGVITARQPLIVNVTTNPGAYSFKISFVYTDEKGMRQIDDQVITLLVYLQPVVEVSFYRDPGPLFLGQPNILPIQIINLGRKSVILGNMRVSSPNGQLMNNTLLVGTLEAGGYFTLDASLIPDLPGSSELIVTVDYNDDFNQPQTISRIIPVDILEMPIIEEPPVDGNGDPGMGIPPQIETETFWQKALRFLRGLIGLDSGVQQPAVPGGVPGEFPSEQPPIEGPSPLPGPAGGKG